VHVVALVTLLNLRVSQNILRRHLESRNLLNGRFCHWKVCFISRNLALLATWMNSTQLSRFSWRDRIIWLSCSIA